MTTAIIIQFSKRAQEYICAYNELKDDTMHKNLDITKDKDKATLIKIKNNVSSV